MYILYIWVAHRVAHACHACHACIIRQAHASMACMQIQAPLISSAPPPYISRGGIAMSGTFPRRDQ